MPFGVGKSTFIQLLSRKEIEIGHGLRSCTKEIQEVEYRIGDRDYTLVDTPGFDDTERTDAEILVLMANWLLKKYKHGTFFSGIIYLHPISDARMSGSSLAHLGLFKTLCGEKSMSVVRMVTTKWQEVTKEDGERREHDLINPDDGYWYGMLKQGGQYHRHDGTDESARKLLSDFSPDQEPVAMILQTELGKENKKLDDTEAGNFVGVQLVNRDKKYEKEIASLREQLAAQKVVNNETSAEIRRSLDRYMKYLHKNEEARDLLRGWRPRAG